MTGKATVPFNPRLEVRSMHPIAYTVLAKPSRRPGHEGKNWTVTVKNGVYGSEFLDILDSVLSKL